MRSFQRCIVALAAALVLGAPLSAQESTPASAAMRMTTPVVSSSPVDVVELGARTLSTAPARSPLTLPEVQARGNKNVALMIVGGAALIVGTLIDGDTGAVVMAGGAVVGLIGLYRYLR